MKIFNVHFGPAHASGSITAHAPGAPPSSLLPCPCRPRSAPAVRRPPPSVPGRCQPPGPSPILLHVSRYCRLPLLPLVIIELPPPSLHPTLFKKGQLSPCRASPPLFYPNQTTRDSPLPSSLPIVGTRPAVSCHLSEITQEGRHRLLRTPSRLSPSIPEDHR
jgi:hypothetical protein